jgi:uncharacterized protein YlzI (FlbEa/FlbD family)
MSNWIRLTGYNTGQSISFNIDHITAVIAGKTVGDQPPRTEIDLTCGSEIMVKEEYNTVMGRIHDANPSGDGERRS